MTTITFDTLKFVRKLKEAGFEEKQAEAVSDAFKEAQGDAQPITKEYLDARLLLLEQRMTIKLGAMLCVGIGVVAALVKLL